MKISMTASIILLVLFRLGSDEQHNKRAAQHRPNNLKYTIRHSYRAGPVQNLARYFIRVFGTDPFPSRPDSLGVRVRRVFSLCRFVCRVREQKTTFLHRNHIRVCLLLPKNCHAPRMRRPEQARPNFRPCVWF